MNRVYSFVVVTRLNDSNTSHTCRSSLNVNQPLQFTFIRHDISNSISYNT